MGALETVPKLAALHRDLEEKVAEAAERLQVPGVAVGVYLGGEEDYTYHGVTSIDNPLEVNEKTFFQIGSTTKTYTATALMVLAGKGLVDLEAPVRKYVPELKLKDESVAQEVTVLNLLNHTGGWYGDVFIDTGDGDDAIARYVEQLAEVDQINPLGTVASYNNAAFVLAGRVIEKVTGKRYEDALKELVLEPLGLEDSLFFPKDVMIRRFVVGHGERDDQLKVSKPWPIPRSSNPAGGLVTTAKDQVKYARFHLGDGSGKDGRQVLTAGALRRMQEPTFKLNGGALGDHVGISWLLREVDGVRVVAHGGTTNGQLAAFELVPERGFAIIVLTNADRGGLLHHELTKWALETYLGLKQPTEEPLDLGPDELKAYAGKFDSKTSVLDIVVEGDHLVVNAKTTEEGLKQARAILGEDPPEPKPIPIKVLPGDRFIVIEGDAKDMKGAILRDESGKVKALDVGGRLAHRVE